ncbi:large exoprotein [Microbacterium sp. cx-59]|uniref:large exoprotein n=1 Tax=Microbacterium sp. cx-59 TaxID=2891207 RepID=UPI001E2D5F00|nr:large exoprotein [Microbacterium sp. cx-59]MCC4908780.1 large exoprotein [Microbacterium sp. cx-59]MCC4908789.1 large exoprotein [Microbacterium sp. cx-59]
MGGQVWGGGVIFLVAVALWMLYLLPSWHSRHLFNASERNAVRLNQALRVLAETSETPQEVRLELNARTALAQQKLARRTQAEKERAELERARVELELAKAEARAVRAAPAARIVRARRAARLTATTVGGLSLLAAGVGVWLWISAGATTLAWVGGVGVLLSAYTLHRMARVAVRAAVRATVVEPAVRTAEVQDVALPVEPRPTWQPRTLPRPLSSSAGSAAAVMRDAADARERLRRAALEEAKRVQAEKAAPTPIETARPVEAAPAASAFSRMGYVDDAEIEEHVRRMLQHRAAG